MPFSSICWVWYRVWFLSLCTEGAIEPQRSLLVIYLHWQKEEDGEILNSLGRPETTFEQSGLGPGQEYEVKLEVVKNSKRGPPASKSVITSESTLRAKEPPLRSLCCGVRVQSR